MSVTILPEALTTLANLKEQLSITDTSSDDKLTNVINRVSVWLESQTNRKLKARNYNGFNAGGGSNFSTTSITSEDYLYFDGDCEQVDERGYGVLYLPVPPLRPSVSGALAFQLAVLSDRVAGADGAGDTWDTTSLAEGSEYVVDYKAGKVTLVGSRFTTGYKNYRVKCTGGFFAGSAQPYVPQDLETLCIELSKQMYNDSAKVQSETIGTWSKTYRPRTDDPFVADTLAKYTRLV